MSSRLKIISCGSIERTGSTLDNVQVMVLDMITKIEYNIYCDRVAIDEANDYYQIKVCNISSGDVIDTCIVDSSGGVFMDDDFCCDKFDDELGLEITELFTNHFIVEF